MCQPHYSTFRPRPHTTSVPIPMTAEQRVHTSSMERGLPPQTNEQRVTPSHKPEEQRVGTQPLRRSTRTTRAPAFMTRTRPQKADDMFQRARMKAADFFKRTWHRPPTPFRMSSSSSDESDAKPRSDDVTYDCHRPRPLFRPTYRHAIPTGPSISILTAPRLIFANPTPGPIWPIGYEQMQRNLSASSTRAPFSPSCTPISRQATLL